MAAADRIFILYGGERQLIAAFTAIAVPLEGHRIGTTLRALNPFRSQVRAWGRWPIVEPKLSNRIPLIVISSTELSEELLNANNSFGNRPATVIYTSEQGVN